MPASTGYCPGSPSPLPDWALLIRPSELGDELALPHYRAPTFHAGFAVEELAGLAHGKPAGDLFFACPWHPCCYVAGRRPGEIGGLL